MAQLSRPRLVMLLLCLLALTAACGFRVPVAHAQQIKAKIWVVPELPGDTLAKIVMPAKGQLPKGYSFESASVQKNAIDITFKDAKGKQFSLSLIYPANADAKVVRSQKFALVGLADLPPPLAKAYLKHIQKNEATFEWKQAETEAIPQPVVSESEKVVNEPIIEEVLEPIANSPTNQGYLVLLYLSISILLGLGFAAWRFLYHYEATTPKHVWDKYDLYALGLLLFFTLLRLLSLPYYPVTGDEASNLEPNFWSEWFMGYESHSSPPLFRLLIHITALKVDSLWSMRILPMIFGSISLWLVYWILRETIRSPRWSMVAMLLVFLQFDHHFYSLHQKSYTLWLVFLLMGFLAFRRALYGDRRQWFPYAMWTLLAVLTHYFSLIYIAACGVYLFVEHRERIKPFLQAIAPAMLSFAVFLIPIFYQERSAIEGGGIFFNTPTWIVVAVVNLVLKSGILGLVFLLIALPRRNVSDNRPDLDALGWMIAFGIIFPFIYGMSTSVQSRFFFPVVPLGIIWAFGRIGVSFKHWPAFAKRTTVFGLGLATLPGIVGMLIFVGLLTQADGGDIKDVVDRYIEATADEEPRPIVTNSCLEIIYYVVNKERVNPDHYLSEGGLRYCYHDNRPFYSLETTTSPADVDALLRKLGSFDYIWIPLASSDQEAIGAANEMFVDWIIQVCTPLIYEPPAMISTFLPSTHRGGTAYRCDSKALDRELFLDTPKVHEKDRRN